MIIYLEDDANMRRHTAKLLKERGYNIESFRRIDQVKEIFDKNKENIECVITDLNMDDSWLGEYKTESDGGMLSGWVWLQRFVYPYIANLPTIIYSGYIPYLKEFLIENNALCLLEREHIKCVEKGSSDDEGFTGLEHTLKELLKKEE